MRRARRYARKTDQELVWDPGHGKGSHGRLFIGDRSTTVQSSEIKKGMLHAMLKQLGIDPKDF